MNVNVIPTTYAEHIARGLVGEEGINVIFPDKNKDGQRYFPNGEVYVRISRVSKLRGRTAVLHSGEPDRDRGLEELYTILDILGQSKSRRKEVFFTYMPYSRQDRKFQPGETNVAKNIVSKLIRYYHVERIHTIDAHFAGRGWMRQYPVTNISAVGLLKQAASRDYPDAVYMGPDAGSQRRTGLKGTKKRRVSSYVVEIKSDEEFRSDVKDKIVGAVDDGIDTGGTLIEFHEKCIECGARDAIVLAIHGIQPEGIKRVLDTYSKLYLTNTIPREKANVDVTKLVLDVLRKGI